MLFCVNIPAENGLLCWPVCVPSLQIIERNGLFSVRVGWSVGMEIAVNGVEEIPNHLCPFRGPSLGEGDKIIQVETSTVAV